MRIRSSQNTVDCLFKQQLLYSVGTVPLAHRRYPSGNSSGVRSTLLSLPWPRRDHLSCSGLWSKRSVSRFIVRATAQNLQHTVRCCSLCPFHRRHIVTVLSSSSSRQHNKRFFCRFSIDTSTSAFYQDCAALVPSPRQFLEDDVLRARTTQHTFRLVGLSVVAGLRTCRLSPVHCPQVKCTWRECAIQLNKGRKSF